MKLDNKTKARILEVIAMTTLADEEHLLGVPQTAESVATLKERAIERYRGPTWEPTAKSAAIQDRYSNNAFHAKVKRTAYLIFEAIEEPLDERPTERILISRDMSAVTFLDRGPVNPKWLSQQLADGAQIKIVERNGGRPIDLPSDFWEPTIG